MDVLHHDVEPSFDDRPRREQTLWASLDRVEPRREGRAAAILDAIDAEFFDRVHDVTFRGSATRGWLTQPEAESGEHVSIVSVPVDRLPGRQRWYRVRLGETSAPADESAHELAFGDSVALQYDTVTGPPLARPLLDLRPATRAEAARLGVAGSLARDENGDPELIEDLLLSVPEITSAAVLDVGQGNWNALLHHGVPTLLFDIGGGVLAHLRSFPPAFSRFCFAEEPPVILSHWDWDHWSSAVRFPEAQNHTWIVPRQRSLGPTHARFLAALRAQGRVIFFPRGRTIRAGELELQQAHGQPTSRNETGLALMVGSDGKAMLFPGDAGYAVLSLPETLTSVVVPHHGGKTRSTRASLPASDGSPAGRAVMSYADRNHFAHPAQESVDLHRGWAADLLATKDRGPLGAPGHVELHWSAPATATPACCPRSALPLPQR